MNPTKLTITEMVADIESGLTAGPEGDSATAPSGEVYKTFVLSIPKHRDDNGVHDICDELIAALWGVLTTYKADQARNGGKFIRWRKHPLINPTDPECATIRCRVLISAMPESIHEIVREEAKPLEPRTVPVPEACTMVYLIVPGYRGVSGKLYDAYGVPLHYAPHAALDRP